MKQNTTITERIPWVDYLRGFITLLVVAHHASLAYTTFASFNKEAYIASTHPIVDQMRWRGMDIFEDFNDIFFMSLMFLISGIFVMSSLQKKGIQLFIKDRFFRLFIPFLIGVTILMLIAYYPAYYLAHGSFNLKAYIIDFFTTEAWPVGPPWFIWVLFLFNFLFAASYPYLKSIIAKLSKTISGYADKPLKILIIWYLVTWITHFPLILWTGPSSWTGIGPFDFQISRVLLYFAYFLMGIIIGSGGINQGILSTKALFIKRWPMWGLSCLFVYALLKLSEAPLNKALDSKQLNLLEATLIYRSIWILSCALSCIAFITLFKQIFKGVNKWWKFLSENAYGIYLIHYIFVIWCQFFLLDLDLPVIIKFIITFVISAGASWGITYLIRKNKYFSPLTS